MHIRRATADDMDFLWEMLYLSVFVPVGSPPLSKKEVLDAPDINLYLTNWGRSGDVAFIVEENAELFGAA